MPPEKHAILSASSSARWLACPPSAALNAKFPDENTPFAAQGTDAHELCEYKVKKALGFDVKSPVEDLEYYDQEMEDSSEEYLQFVMQQIAEAKELCPEPFVMVEQRLDYSRFVPQGFGTGDCVIVADKQLQIIDFKYGLGVEVSAENNSQMMCYAIGAYDLFSDLYDIDSVKVSIFQPRKSHISSWSISIKDLMDWAENELKPKAELAAKGEGDFKAGDHCRFCKVRHNCRKRAELNLALARYDFAAPETLTDTEISAILESADRFTSWLSDIKDYALSSALEGKKWPEYKLVEGRSVRKYTDEALVATKVFQAGLDPYERKLIGITEMTKMLGKAKFNELLGDLVFKPQGKPTLVPATDKRPEISTINDFKED